jgi:hypothetical protein
VQGYQFEYEIEEVTRMGATIKYTERVYFPGADHFETFKEGDETQTMQYPLKDIDAAHDIWHAANAKVNSRLWSERERLKRVQDSAKVDEQEEDYCLVDIEEYFTKHGRGSHMLEYDFEPDTPEPVPYTNRDGKPSIYQCWTHKHTKYTVKRYAALNGKDVDSGRLSKYLKRIKQSVHPLAYARAKKIMDLNDVVASHSEEVVAVPVALDRRDLLKQQVCHHVIYYCIVRSYSKPPLPLVPYRSRLSCLQWRLVLLRLLFRASLRNVFFDISTHNTIHLTV